MAKIVRIRRQSGARIVTLPAALLERIGADTGTKLALDIHGGAIVAKPVSDVPATRRRYTLDELLVGANQLPELYGSVGSVLEGDPAGKEFA